MSQNKKERKTRNQYAKCCSKCGGVVQPGAGWLTGKKGKWEVVHEHCPSITELMDEDDSWCGIDDKW